MAACADLKDLRFAGCHWGLVIPEPLDDQIGLLNSQRRCAFRGPAPAYDGNVLNIPNPCDSAGTVCGPSVGTGPPVDFGVRGPQECARVGPHPHNRKASHRVFRDAKREHWAGMIDDVDTDVKAYKLASWAKYRAPAARGPITVGEVSAKTDLDKLNLLVRKQQVLIHPTDLFKLEPPQLGQRVRVPCPARRTRVIRP